MWAAFLFLNQKIIQHPDRSQGSFFWDRVFPYSPSSSHIRLSFWPGERRKNEMANCLENLFVDGNPKQPYPKNGSSASLYISFFKSSTEVQWREFMGLWTRFFYCVARLMINLCFVRFVSSSSSSRFERICVLTRRLNLARQWLKLAKRRLIIISLKVNPQTNPIPQ